MRSHEAAPMDHCFYRELCLASGNAWAGQLPTDATPGTDKRPARDPARLERIRSAKMPPISRPVLFNTPEADAILAALEVFPPDNPWNQLITEWAVHPNSKAIVASVGIEKPLRYNPDMGFVLVPPDQRPVGFNPGGRAA